jgi:succinate dehydrogenase/fumarate reductase flavoprotein subunit
MPTVVRMADLQSRENGARTGGACWDLEADVVVVGGGNAGLPAAISAHDAGAEVVIVEENQFLGGLMRGSGGFMFFCDTHVQRQAGIEDRVDWGVEDEMWMSEYRAVPEIVRAYVEQGAETCLWLEQLGLTWSPEVLDGDYGAGAAGDRSVARTHVAGVSPSGYYPGGVPEGQNGYALTVVLEKAVGERAIHTLMGHRMTRIVREDDGPVSGIIASTRTGSVRIRARRAVVLAGGGATTNEQLVKAWDPRLVNDAVYSDGLPYMRAMGDAIVAGVDAGGGLSDMSFVCFTPIKYGTHTYSLSLSTIAGDTSAAKNTGVPIIARRGAYQRVILVKADGRRYVNEALAAHENPDLVRDVAGLPPAEYPEEPFIRTFLSLPNPKNVWAITDAEGAAALRWPLEQMAAPTPTTGRALHPDSVAVASSIAELAARIHMPIDELTATIARYNRSAAAGVDSEFGKPAPLFSIGEPPFYAAKLNIIRHTPGGGLRINSRGQVLDRSAQWDGAVAASIDEEKVIPKLYAAGECAAFVGFRRAHRKTGPILTMGRIAGIAAAAERSTEPSTRSIEPGARA